VAHVEAISCHLNPYAGAGGILRYFIELLWLIAYIVSLFLALRRCGKGMRASLRELWTWAELVCFFSYAAIVVGWLVYLISDRSTFQMQHPTEFKDLYSVCSRYDATTSFAAISVIWAFVQVARCIRPHPPTMLLWQGLAHAVAALLPFTMIVLICIVAFSHSGAWVFGAQVYDFHTWVQTVGFLLRSMIAGLTTKRQGQEVQVMEAMIDVKPAFAYLWTVMWTLISELVIFNMFVAILVASFASVAARSRCAKQLESDFPSPTWASYFRSKFSRFQSNPEVCMRLRTMHAEEQAWQAHLAVVDRDRLQALVLDCVARGAQDLQLKDAAKLFPHQDAPESYRQAAAWMTSLAEALGMELQRTPCRPSTAQEVRVLMAKVAKLEEEALLLIAQLKTAQQPSTEL